MSSSRDERRDDAREEAAARAASGDGGVDRGGVESAGASSAAARPASASRPARARVRVRAAVPRDGRALASLMDAVYAEGRWFVGDAAPGGEALVRRLRGLDPTHELYLVAEGAGPDGELVGWIELHRYLPWRLEHVASLTIAVAAHARGRGVGRTLMRAVLPWARRVGVRKIRLDVRAGNEAAIALYRSEGYRVEGVERDQIRCEDGYEDNVVMARFVAPVD